MKPHDSPSVIPVPASLKTHLVVPNTPPVNPQSPLAGCHTSLAETQTSFYRTLHPIGATIRLRPLWLVIRLLQLALRPLRLDLRLLQLALRPLQQAQSL